MERQLAREWMIPGRRSPVLLCGSSGEIDRLRAESARYPDLRLVTLAGLEDATRDPVLVESCSGVIASYAAARGYLDSELTGSWTVPDVPLLVLLDAPATDDDLSDLLRGGASGFLQADCSLETVNAALRSAHRGEVWATRRVLSSALQQFSSELQQRRFTPREREILERIAQGDTNRDIAKRLFITRDTVRWHLRCLYTKMGVHNRGAIIALMKGEPPLGRTVLRHDRYDPPEIGTWNSTRSQSA